MWYGTPVGVFYLLFLSLLICFEREREREQVGEEQGERKRESQARFYTVSKEPDAGLIQEPERK